MDVSVWSADPKTSLIIGSGFYGQSQNHIHRSAARVDGRVVCAEIMAGTVGNARHYGSGKTKSGSFMVSFRVELFVDVEGVVSEWISVIDGDDGGYREAYARGEMWLFLYGAPIIENPFQKETASGTNP